MGEDTDFYRDLRKLARRTGGRVRLIRSLRVRPPAGASIDLELFIAFLRRWKAAWAGWYSRVVR